MYTLFSETVELNGLLTIRAAEKSIPYAAANSVLLGRSQIPFYLTNVARLWLATIVGIFVHKMVDVAISISTVQKYRMMLVGTYLIRSYAKNKSVDTEVFEWEVLGKIVALSSEMGSAR